MTQTHPGMVFRHAELQSKSEPVTCMVTKADAHVVYYREVETGKRRSSDALAFPRLVGEFLFTFDYTPEDEPAAS